MVLKLQIVCCHSREGYWVSGNPEIGCFGKKCGSFSPLAAIQEHTSYLSFALHRQDFQIPNFTPKNN